MTLSPMPASQLVVIDAHVHLWDSARFTYPWITPELALPAAVGEPELAEAMAQAEESAPGVQLVGCVAVEAGRKPHEANEEVDWLSDQLGYRPRPWSWGVVAHADVELGGDTVAGQLSGRRLAVVGIRRNLQDEGYGYMSTAAFRDGLAVVEDEGLPFEVCVRSPQLPEVVDMCAAAQGLTFILDHVGKPAIASGRDGAWFDLIRDLAALPNVVCKLSGLTTEAKWSTWSEAEIRPYLDHALTEFGPNRCLYGSDWPVATLATTPGRWMRLVLAALSGASADDRRRVLSGTAIVVYGLSDTSDRR